MIVSPTISIVTPSFNQGQFIEQSIDSVLSQGYVNLEYIIIDGGSTDNTREIIKKYEKHLKYWVSEPDRGQSHAINKGLARCTGDIFNWINSDDYYEPNALKIVADAFEDESKSMVSFRANVFGLQQRTSRGTDIFPGNLPKAIAYSRIDQPETFFRMTAVKEMGPVNENLHYCMDKEWLLRYFLLFGNENAINRDDIILNFRYHEDSKSVQRQAEFETEADLIYLELANDNPPIASLIDEVLLRDKHRVNLGIKLPSEQLEPSLLDAALQYYLFKRFVEKYEALDLAACNRIAHAIQLDLLSEKDKAQITRLMRRSKRLSPFLIKLLRKASR